ncbi:MAG: hypothetical protein IPM24_12170 [Bryobacterales bacterium]|nr:hypothetical protein [Bryobacterales bacterium]
MKLFRFVAGATVLASLLASEPPSVPPSPASMHPFAGMRGEPFEVVIRGTDLGAVRSAFSEESRLRLTVGAIEPEPPNEANAKSKKPFELLRLRVESPSGLEPGQYDIRLVSPHGVSNALPLHIMEFPVLAEPAGSHDSEETAVRVESAPALYAGRIERRGEVDFYEVQAKQGQTLTFQVLSGLPAPGSPGGNARGFDPAVTIFEPSGSWFDPGHMRRVAFSDEPLWVIGRATDTHLVHTFAKDGRYLVRVEAFSGQGSPDYSYQFRILPGEAPAPASHNPDWQERSYTRPLSANRLNELAERGGIKPDKKSIETYRASADGPEFRLPGTLLGTIAEPGEMQRARFQIDTPQDIAIEVETPADDPPLFNPVVRLLNASGEEVASNLMAGRGACSGALNKSLQAKTVVPLRDTGEYTVEIRDATSDLAGPGFQYKVQVRPQVPHVGDVGITADRLNLKPGGAETVRVNFDREEDYRGAVAVLVEGLPPGVQALAGADFEPDKDPPMHAGKRERYTPRRERSVVVFTASDDARPTPEPHLARIVVRPVAGGKPGPVIASKTIPVMVVGHP